MDIAMGILLQLRLWVQIWAKMEMEMEIPLVTGVHQVRRNMSGRRLGLGLGFRELWLNLGLEDRLIGLLCWLVPVVQHVLPRRLSL
jgi:hypothetical protein